jgi:hypothetical protein
MGDTVCVALVDDEVWTKSSDHVSDHGPAPCREEVKVALCPRTIVLVPLTVEVGFRMRTAAIPLDVPDAVITTTLTWSCPEQAARKVAVEVPWPPVRVPFRTLQVYVAPLTGVIDAVVVEDAYIVLTVLTTVEGRVYSMKLDVMPLPSTIFGVAFCMSCALRNEAFPVACRCSSRAIAPETCGVAADVPEKVVSPPLLFIVVTYVGA